MNLRNACTKIECLNSEVKLENQSAQNGKQLRTGDRTAAIKGNEIVSLDPKFSTYEFKANSINARVR